MNKTEIELLEITSELGAGTRGSSLGVGALKVVAFNSKSDFFSRYNSSKVKNFNQFLFTKNTTPRAIRIEHIEKEFKEISSNVKNILTKGKFPFLLSGDHSTAASTIAGIQESFPDKRLGVIWVDAHADLHSPYTSPSGNVHGMPLAIACGLDNKTQQVAEVNPETVQYWENLKNLSKNKLKTKDLVFMGVRDTEEPEDYIIESEGIKNFRVVEILEKGGRQVAKETLDLLSDCDIIYVSFDVDCMDPQEISSGTGTPVKDGIRLKDVTEILTELCQSPKLVCFEIVEINPCLDDKINKMAETGFQIIDSLTKIIENR